MNFLPVRSRFVTHHFGLLVWFVLTAVPTGAGISTRGPYSSKAECEGHLARREQIENPWADGAGGMNPSLCLESLPLPHGRKLALCSGSWDEIRRDKVKVAFFHLLNTIQAERSGKPAPQWKDDPVLRERPKPCGGS